MSNVGRIGFRLLAGGAEWKSDWVGGFSGWAGCFDEGGWIDKGNGIGMGLLFWLTELIEQAYVYHSDVIRNNNIDINLRARDTEHVTLTQVEI